jgi:hypothetical protein
VLTILLVAIGSILPLTLYFFDSIRASPQAIYFVTDPFHTLYRLAEDDPESNVLLVTLMAASLMSVALNLRAMLAGVIDLTRPYVPHAPAMPRVVDEVVLS